MAECLWSEHKYYIQTSTGHKALTGRQTHPTLNIPKLGFFHKKSAKQIKHTQDMQLNMRGHDPRSNYDIKRPKGKEKKSGSPSDQPSIANTWRLVSIKQ